MHRLSVDVFDEDVVDNTNLSQYYPQNNAPYYPRHANFPLHPQSTYVPQDINYQPQQNPTFTTPHHPQYTSSSHEMIEEPHRKFRPHPPLPQKLQPQVYPHRQLKQDHQKRRGRQLTPPTMHLGGIFMNKQRMLAVSCSAEGAR
jgi:hypothetical protein